MSSFCTLLVDVSFMTKIYMEATVVMVVAAAYFIFVAADRKLSHRREIRYLSDEHRRAVLQTRIEIQEQTFSNISRDIHDHIGQKLTYLKFQLEMKPAEYKLEPLCLQVGEVMQDLRNLSRGLSADLVEMGGLVYGIEHEVELLEGTGWFKIDLDVTGDDIRLRADREIFLYRICQEALQNIVKHAAAKNIKIRLHFDPKELMLFIEDDGKGFNAGETQGNGLKNMKLRTQVLGGVFIIESTGTGTCITVKVPVHEKK